MSLFVKSKFAVNNTYGSLGYKRLLNNMVSFFLHKNFKVWQNNRGLG